MHRGIPSGLRPCPTAPPAALSIPNVTRTTTRCPPAPSPSSPPGASSCARASASRSSRRAAPPTGARSWPCRRATRTAASRPPTPRCARCARRPASRPGSSRSSATSATGTCAAAGGSPRSSASSCSTPSAARPTPTIGRERTRCGWRARPPPAVSPTRASATWRRRPSGSCHAGENLSRVLTAMQVLNFYSTIFADQLKRGRKTATIRLGDKSHKYKKNQAVLVTIGYQHSPREKIFEAVIDQVEVKRVKDLSPRDIEHDNPEFRRHDEMIHFLEQIYARPVSMDDTVTVVRFSQIIEHPPNVTDARLGIGGAQN